MRFEYVARDAAGHVHRGGIESEDHADAVRRLGIDGLTPVQLTASEAPTARPIAARRGRRIRPADQVMLLQELSKLLSAGVSLGDALPSLAQAYSKHVLGEPLEALHQAVLGGARLSDALRRSRLGLSEHVLALTQAGEASGQLGRVLADAAQQMEFQRRVAEDLRSALIYPTVLIVAGTLAVFVIFVGVVPRFASLISGAKADVPALSRAIIEAGLYVRGHLLQFGLAALALASLAGFGLANDRVRASLLQAMLRVPGDGKGVPERQRGRGR